MSDIDNRIILDKEESNYLHDLCMFHEMELLKQKEHVKSTIIQNQIAQELLAVEIMMRRLKPQDVAFQNV